MKVAEAISRTVPYVIRNIGNVEAWNTVDVTPQVSGQIVAIHFAEGAMVRRGDPLFTIDPRIYEAELGEAEGQLNQAKSALEFNRERVKRFSELLPEDYVSKLDFENYVSQAGETVGQVEQYRAAVEKGLVNVGYTQITSPLPGKTSLRNYDLGNVVSPEDSKPLITINQLCPIYVVFTIPEKQFPLIQKYNTSKGLLVEACPMESGALHMGTLDYLTNQIDSATGTATLRAHYENNDLSLWPGQYCTVTVHLYDIPDAVLIPVSAIGIDTKGHFAFVIKEGDKAQLRRITVGQQHDKLQVIESGIKAGEVVITDGIISVAPGAKVNIQN